MKKLLVVDDDAFLRDLYVAKFQESEFDVVSAGDATQAMGIISRSADFDVILLDMTMPGLGGIELLQEIKDCFPDMQAKYIFLSNQGQPADAAATETSSAIGYIIKTESIPSEVVSKVSHLISLQS